MKHRYRILFFPLALFLMGQAECSSDSKSDSWNPTGRWDLVAEEVVGTQTDYPDTEPPGGSMGFSDIPPNRRPDLPSEIKLDLDAAHHELHTSLPGDYASLKEEESDGDQRRYVSVLLHRFYDTIPETHCRFQHQEMLIAEFNAAEPSDATFYARVIMNFDSASCKTLHDEVRAAENTSRFTEPFWVALYDSYVLNRYYDPSPTRVRLFPLWKAVKKGR